jgi:hypothetical protein
LRSRDVAGGVALGTRGFALGLGLGTRGLAHRLAGLIPRIAVVVVGLVVTVTGGGSGCVADQGSARQERGKQGVAHGSSAP